MNLPKLFEDLISKKAKDAEQITKAKGLLHRSIDKAGGWDELEKAMLISGKKSKGHFSNNLTDAVLSGQDEMQIAEAITFYRIIAAVQMDGEVVADVARKLGFGMGKKHYSKQEASGRRVVI